MSRDRKQNFPASDMEHTEEMSFIVLSHGNLGFVVLSQNTLAYFNNVANKQTFPLSTYKLSQKTHALRISRQNSIILHSSGYRPLYQSELDWI